MSGASPLGWLNAAAITLDRGSADARWDRDILWLMLVRGADTGGRWSLMDQLCRQGSGPPPHRHIWSDEMLYVVEGQATFLVGETISNGGAGTMVFVPRNTRHGFRVDSPVARILNSYTPASWEEAVDQLSAVALTRTLPPVGFQPGKPDFDVAKLMACCGMVSEDGRDPLRAD